MSIVSVLNSLNKIALIAFAVTLGVLIYEILLLQKSKRVKQKPVIPKFKEGDFILAVPQASDKYKSISLDSKNKVILFTLIVMLIFFGVLTAVSFVNLKSTSQPKKLSLGTRASAVSGLNPTLSSSPFPPEPSETPALLSQELNEPDQPPAEVSLTPTIEITLTPTEAEETASSASPTLIKQLPKTGYLYNSLILFSVTGLFLIFSFLF